MTSLFAKILLWFLATIVITTTAVIVTSALTFNSTSQPPFGMMLRLQLREARYAYENGGRDALAAAIRRFQSVVQADMILADAQGKDLVTGEDRSDLIRRAAERRRLPLYLPFTQRNGITFGRSSLDGRYWFFLIPPPRKGFSWFFHPYHLVILAVVVLLCYGLAYYLTSPVRSLQRAVVQFGKGDLSARAPASRRDELGKLARTFNQMADRIQTLVTAERRLLMDISHELRSPLARLSVAIELARSGHDHDASLDRIQKEGERLNELVGELLEVTRAEGDPAQRRHESIALDELLAEVVDDSQIEAVAHGVRLDLPQLDPCRIDADPELIRRAVENVIRNAIRYSPAGEPVEVRLLNQAGRACVSVRDHGPGVPEESVNLLFEPFYRVDSDRNRGSGGVGLGLSIARRAVALHQGSIRAANARPGLLVEIELPVAAEAGEPAPMPSASAF